MPSFALADPTARYQWHYDSAIGHLTNNRPIAAQLALRRAFGFAQSQSQQSQLRAAYALAAQANPLTLNISASIAPSSNINGGANDAFFFLGPYRFAFAPSSRALSGLEYSAQFDMRYRLALSARGSSNVGISLFGRSYVMSSAAKALAPDASGSDYAMTKAEIALRQEVNLGAAGAAHIGATKLSLHFGEVESAARPLYGYSKITLSQDFHHGPRKTVTFAGAYEAQTSRSPLRANAQVFDLSLGYKSITQKNAAMEWLISSRKNLSVLTSDTFTDSNLQVNFTPTWRMLRAKPSFSAGLGYKTYDDFILSLDGRRDTYTWAGVALLFEDISVFGFSPEMTITQRRNRSNVGRYDTGETKIGLGVQSRF